MRGLLISLSVILVMTAVGLGSSTLVHLHLTSSLASARSNGLTEGNNAGYEEGLIDGSIAGYQAGSKAGYNAMSQGNGTVNETKGFYFLYNPTYSDVLKMLADTDLDSLDKFIDYAASNGIRIAYVRTQSVPVDSAGNVYLYDLVGFDTVDNGFVVIDPGLHRQVQGKVGESYSGMNGLPAPDYKDIIGKVTVIW